MQQENNGQARTRARRFTITGNYDNARQYGPDKIQIEHGDVCTVRPGAPYQRGDLVLAECSDLCTNGQTTPHYHANYFFPLPNGAKFAFRLHRWPSGGGGTRYKAGQEQIIVGPVISVIKKGRQENARQVKGRLSGIRRSSHKVSFNWSYFGVHKYDTLIVDWNGKAPVGKLILLKNEDGESTYFHRVCCVRGDIVRVTNDTNEPHDEPLSLVCGPVVEIEHAECAPTKIKKLQAEVDRYEESDHAYVYEGKIAELKEEIYRLEQSLLDNEDEEAGEDFEWPEVIGDE